jgi:hypothetical protein
MRHLVPFQRSARVPEFENPTPVQAEAEAQETALKIPPPAAGLGDGTMRHRAPFHRSASVPTGLPELSKRPPTAVQAEGPVQATLARLAFGTLAGFGVGWMRQARPFRRSASVLASPELFVESPVVVHAEGVVQDTGPMRAPCAPAGAAMGRIFQVLPFQRSASGFGLGVLWPEAPIAMQNDHLGHDTPPKLTPGGPTGLGVG